MRRLSGLDLIRGVGILVVVFLHACLYQFDKLLELDFKNPPLVITVIGLLLMLAGIFAVISGAAHMYAWTSRLEGRKAGIAAMRRSLLITGVLLLVLNLLYFQLLGPTLLDIPKGNHRYSLLNGLIETGSLPRLSWERFFYNTALSMLGWNCIVVGLLAPLIFPQGRTRAGLGHAFSTSVPRSRLSAAAGVFSLIWLAAGVVGYLTLPDTMLERSVDEMWYFIIVGQVGLFVLLVIAAWRLWDSRAKPKPELMAARSGLLRLCGAASLTIFTLETPVRSLYALLWDALFPGWSANIPVVLIFAAPMTLLWIGVIRLWLAARFVGSVEWLVGRIYSALGRPSSKEEAFAGTR